jgi:hypothetical protein
VNDPGRAYDSLVDTLGAAVVQSASEVSAALALRTAEVTADIYDLIVREIPQLRSDNRVLALLEASVSENVATTLHILEHGIAVDNVHAPAAAAEYARRLAQRGVPMTALLRAYRIGATRFQDWCLRELGRHTDDPAVLNAAGPRIAEITAVYIDRVSEELVTLYAAEQGNWLRNLSVARAARVRALLRAERVDIDSSEAILGYRLRQHHLGVVCWIDVADASGGALTRLERAAAEVCGLVGGAGRPLFLPQDESSAWAWLPLGVRDTARLKAEPAASADGVRFALGAVGAALPGFRRTHRQALGAQAVALAAGPAGRMVTCFTDVAPVALMSGSVELAREWVAETLGALADADEHNARLRDTLRIFLQENGSFKATAERMTLHKNTVQYRVRKAEEGLGRPLEENRLDVELALLASHWLGTAVLRPSGN